MAGGREGSGMVPKMCEKVLGLSGSVGQRSFAHSLHAVEHSREEWAAW